MNKLSYERLDELKAAANEQGKESYEVMTNEELAAYRNNCLESIEIRNQTIVRYDGVGAMAQIAQEGIAFMEEAIAYIDSKLAEQKNPLDQFLAQWKEAAEAYYTNLRDELDGINNTDYEINEENLRSITNSRGKQKYSDSSIEKLLNNDIPSFTVRNLKVEISRSKYKEWADDISSNDLNFVDMMRRFDNYLEDSLEFMVKEKKMLFLSRVKKKAGNILNLNGLTLGEDGSINGLVVGEEKTVNVKTVFAGGHNVQCLHYRVLVK